MLLLSFDFDAEAPLLKVLPKSNFEHMQKLPSACFSEEMQTDTACRMTNCTLLSDSVRDAAASQVI